MSLDQWNADKNLLLNNYGQETLLRGREMESSSAASCEPLGVSSVSLARPEERQEATCLGPAFA
jgi:hypothetical protein